uniref:Pectinesterase inhibitor domain-containing protein n=1 Tax=Solanum lycopersicum TaxID=4081 RepID=A0A3Q7I078_SOLLC
MGRSISCSLSSSLIFLLPYIFLFSVDLFGTNLSANHDTHELIQKVCDFSNVQQFCYNIFENDPRTQWATTKLNLEDITIQLAYSNYTKIARKVLIVTSSEKNSQFKRIYRSCLHHYILLRSDLENLVHVLRFQGDLDQVAQNASSHILACMDIFTQYSNIPNPFANDNKNLLYFFELIRNIYFTPLEL